MIHKRRISKIFSPDPKIDIFGSDRHLIFSATLAKKLGDEIFSGVEIVRWTG
jgi:hypothetical protein